MSESKDMAKSLNLLKEAEWTLHVFKPRFFCNAFLVKQGETQNAAEKVCEAYFYSENTSAQSFQILD